MLIGDVNQPLDSWDKCGGRPVNRVLADRLRHTVDTCNLMDLHYSGPKFTWTNGRKGSALINERIDRAWCNMLWNQTFDGTTVRHLMQAASDHHPLLLGTVSTPTRPPYKGFRFLEAWFQHPEFPSQVEALWKKEPLSLQATVDHFKAGIWQWNQLNYGNIFWRKKRCKALLSGLQVALNHYPRRSLYKLEQHLLDEWNDILT